MDSCQHLENTYRSCNRNRFSMIKKKILCLLTHTIISLVKFSFNPGKRGNFSLKLLQFCQLDQFGSCGEKIPVIISFSWNHFGKKYLLWLYWNLSSRRWKISFWQASLECKACLHNVSFIGRIRMNCLYFHFTILLTEFPGISVCSVMFHLGVN